LILARGPFDVDDEIALMRDERIDVLVTKNSGGRATEAKLAAARALGIAVIVVERPATPAVPTFHFVDLVLARIDAQRPLPERRGGSSQGGLPGRSTNRVSLDPMRTSVLMSATAGSALARSASTIRSSSRPTARANATGVDPALHRRSSAKAS